MKKLSVFAAICIVCVLVAAAPLAVACIDNIVYTCKTLRLTNGKVVENDLADHYMLTASFKTLA